MPHNTDTPSTPTGNVLIDGMLLGSQWDESTITYAFPTSSAAYNGGLPGYNGGDWHLANFQPFSSAWEAHAVAMLAEVASFTGLTFIEGDEATSSLRWGRFDDPYNGAYAYGPFSGEAGGDQWFANNANADPVTGDGVSHIIRHELGHALGLSHPHQGAFDTVPLEYDSQEYSAMSYRLHTDYQPGDFSGIHNEQSFMLLDILALQHMYGANFTFNATNTTYGFNANGQFVINGVAGSAPSHSVVLRTIWDGGGVDTYDFSNFSNDQTVDLAPGAWSTFNPAMRGVMIQRASDVGPLVPIYAAGNLANAFQYQGDARSLIENAVTGAGNDSVRGNSADNMLDGNGGADSLYGLDGDDLLIGGGGADTLDGGAGMDRVQVDSNSNTATWTRNTSGSWTVTSADGTDTLTDVEFIMFNDRTLHLDRAVHNFHGDGTSDVLLRRSDGVTAIWDMEGATVTNADVTQYQAPTDWQIEGIGDFNADGRDDFLLRRDGDQVTAIWSMSGTQVLAADVTNWQAGAEWQIQGIGDFNSDGYDDIMWRRTDGVTAIWQLNGTTVASGDVTNWQAGNEWVIKGIGDFDGDGNDDLLLQRDSDGVIAMWQMDGATVTSGNITSQQAGLDWQIAGVGDFNGDGRDDLLLQRTSDALVAVWTMNGANVTNASLTSSQTGFGWDVVGVGDYSGDGQDDILWRNGDGTLVVWTMDGPTVLAVEVTSAQVGNEWTVI